MISSNTNSSVLFVGQENLFQAKLKKLKETKEIFFDPDFPGNFNSLWGFGENKYYKKKDWENYKWLRADQLYFGKKFDVYNKINPSDIIQGNLGDCYFLSAISALAERPDRIKK